LDSGILKPRKAKARKRPGIERRPSSLPRDGAFEHPFHFVLERSERESILAVGETAELRQSLRQQMGAAGGPLAAGSLVERRRDLDETLEKEPARAGGGEPLGLPHLVRLEEPAGIEEASAGLESGASRPGRR
jgi:hypothetical protein